MNWLLLQNSLWISGLATCLALTLGSLCALWTAALPRRWQMGVMLAAVIALALPPFLVTSCWLHLLGHTGAWRGWLPLNIYSQGGTVWLLALLTWPISFFFVLGAWQRVERSQLESEPALYGWALVRWLLLPLARSALVLSGVLTFVFAFNNFAVPAILQAKVFPAELWVDFSTNLDPSAALRLGWPVVLAPALLLAWLSRRSLPWPALEGGVPTSLFRGQLGAWFFWSCGALALLLILLSVALPVGQLCVLKRTWTELPSAFAAGRTALWNSFFTAAVSATTCVGIGLAFWQWRGGPVLWLLFFIPGVLLGIALILGLNRPSLSALTQSMGIVLIGFTVHYLALGWSGAAHAMRAVDRDLTDAAKLCGASSGQILRHVQWPQIAPTLAAAWYVTYLLCLWDVETLVLIVPPGGETLALRVFNLLHYGWNDQVNALCLMLLGLAVLPLVLWGVAGWGRKRFFGLFDAIRLVASAATNRRFMEGLHFNMTRIGTSNPGWSRQRLGLRQPSAAFAAVGGSESSRGLARSKTWRRFERFTGKSNASAFAKPLRTGASALLMIGVISALLCGCNPSATNQTSIQSLVFSSVQIIGGRGTALGQFNKPRSVTIDASDNLYVVDMTGRVQKFSPDGAFVSSWQMPQTDLGKPKGLCRDREGNIVVIEPHYSRVNHFLPDGKLVRQWGDTGTNQGQLMFPRAAAVNARGEIFVSEYGKVERVQKFSEAGRAHILSFGEAGTGNGGLNRAEGLGLDRQGNLFVADSCNHRVQIFSPEGKFLKSYGKAGVGPGEMSYPYDVQVDAEGRQFVCEFGNSRVQIFDSGGGSLEILGGAGAAPGQFNNPWGLALDSKGNLYVADSRNHRVQKFVRRKTS